MKGLELEGYDVAVSAERTVKMSGSVLECALNLFQFSMLTGDNVEGIWKQMEFELHEDPAGDVVLAPRKTFERIQALFDDPETQKRISAHVERLMKDAPVDENKDAPVDENAEE
jgi:hypothetical protein